jgi:hypothetical protein
MASVGAAAAAVLVFGTVALPGCGGGDGEDPEPRADPTPAPPAVVAQPVARAPIASQIAPFTRAVGAQSCRAFQLLRSSFIRGRPPGTPATNAECGRGDRGLVALRGDAVDRAAQFKTGALMEGPAAGGGRQWTAWVLDGDGRFRYTGVAGASAQVGTPLGKRTEAERVAAAFVRSIRDRDCTAMARLFSPAGSRLVTSFGSARAACRVVLRGRFIAPAVRETPGLRPELLGGTKDLAFVGLPTRHTYFTLMLGDLASPTLRVVDVLPSTPVDLKG